MWMLRERDGEGERETATCMHIMSLCGSLCVMRNRCICSPFHTCMHVFVKRQAGRQTNRERENLVQQKIILFIAIGIYLLWTLAEIKFCWNCIRFKRFLLPPSVETVFFKMCRAQHCRRWRCVACCSLLRFSSHFCRHFGSLWGHLENNFEKNE